VDDRPVEPHRATKSSGTENTYSEDLTEIHRMRQEIDEMARGIASWLARKDLSCRTVTIKVRYADFATITRSHSRMPPTRNADEIAERAVALLDRTDAAVRPVRLLGVSVHNLDDPSEPGVRSDGPLLPF
jgi:DNA polymerase-4